MLLHLSKFRVIICPRRISSLLTATWIKRDKSTAVKARSVLNLHKRGLLEDIFPNASIKLPEQMTSRQCFYCGFDPTSDSLHIGNLISLMLLLHCQRAGHDVIAVIGDATARIGDPSDQTKDRKQLSREVLQQNIEGLERCIQNLFDNHKREVFVNRDSKELPKLRILRNSSWFQGLNIVDFLAKEGRHFRMGPMLDKRFVRDRLESEEGLLLPEFLYQVFQAYDWLHLFKNYNCRFQIGGSDQLGNMNAGRRLIDRVAWGEVYGLLSPLITTPTGQKVGKTAGNAVWLHPEKTPPFEFYQYFLRQRDSDVEKLLKFFTFIELPTIANIMEEHRKYPERRNAQLVLARNICKLIHGEEGVTSAERCTKVLFHGAMDELENLTDEEVYSTFKGMNIHHAVLDPATTIYDIAVKIKAVPEGSIGMETIRKGGVAVNGIRMKAAEQILLSDFHILKNDLSLITVGKKNHFVVRWKIPDRRLMHSQNEKLG